MFSTLPTVWYFDSGGKPFLNTDLVDKAEQIGTAPQVVVHHINPRGA